MEYSFLLPFIEVKMAPKGKATLPKTLPPAMKKNTKGKKKANKEEVDQLRSKSKNKKEEEDEEDGSGSSELLGESVYFF